MVTYESEKNEVDEDQSGYEHSKFRPYYFVFIFETC